MGSPQPILLVTPWYGGNKGGVAVSTHGLAGALMHVGVPVVVLHFGTERLLPEVGRGSYGEVVVRVGAPPSRLGGGGVKAAVGRGARRAVLAATLAWIRARWGVRLVHFHYCVEEYDAAIGAARRLGLPIVTTFRGSEINLHFDSPEVGDVIRRLIDASVQLTAVSEGLADAVRRRAPAAAGRLRVIRNAVPIDFWQRAAGESAAADDGEENGKSVDVAFVGNLLPVKGPDQLLTAFRRVLDRRPGTTLALVGSGPMEPELRATIAAQGMEPYVRFVGRVPREEVAGRLRDARLVAVPSRNEGLPLTAAEAQLLGVPVVATEVGGVPEIVLDGETGIVVPPGDMEAFADGLLALLTDDQRRATFAKTARERTREAFNPLRMAREYAALYDEVDRAP